MEQWGQGFDGKSMRLDRGTGGVENGDENDDSGVDEAVAR